MKDRISVEGRDGTFNAYIARPKTLPASTVVVLQELFGVNADIRKTCDELAECLGDLITVRAVTRAHGESTLHPRLTQEQHKRNH